MTEAELLTAKSLKFPASSSSFYTAGFFLVLICGSMLCCPFICFLCKYGNSLFEPRKDRCTALEDELPEFTEIPTYEDKRR